VKRSPTDWLLFIVLSVIWGSSFILMKEGLQRLTSFQVASIRIFTAGLVLLPWTLKFFRDIPRNKLLTVFISGALGNLVPAYLFCIAEENIDSALAGTLNSLTPIFVIITGALFFNAKVAGNKVVGIIIALTGSVMLLLSKQTDGMKASFTHGMLIVIATLMYGINVNLVHKYLHNIPSLKIASVALSLCAIPALIMLYSTGFFQLPLGDHDVLLSTFYSSLLGVAGTAVATIVFYMLVKRSGIVFSSMVTYCIPIVANFWGIILHEQVGWLQFFCLVFILVGVYIGTRTRNALA
jgi:drug/metabolite transporter (DMT)-like permease